MEKWRGYKNDCKTTWNRFREYLLNLQEKKYLNFIITETSFWLTRCLIIAVWIALVYSISLPIRITYMSDKQTNLTTNGTSNVCHNKTLNIVLPSHCNSNNYSNYYSTTLSQLNKKDEYSFLLTFNSELDSSRGYTFNLSACKDSTGNILTIERNLFQDISDNHLSITTLALLITFSAALGYVSKRLFLSPMFGMVLAGIIFTNIPHGNFPVPIPRSISYTCRIVAIANILGRVGLNLSKCFIKSKTLEILGLGLIPASVEVALVSILAIATAPVRWQWAFMSGSLVAAIAPTIIVPLMQRLKQRGTDKSIPHILITATGIDNIFIVSIFFISRAVAFSSSTLEFTIFRGPIELSIGVIYGICFGLLGWKVGWRRKKESLSRHKSFYFFGISLLSVFGSSRVTIYDSDILGAGAMGVIVAGIACSFLWSDEDKETIDKHLHLFWQFLEPMIFGLIGYELNVQTSSLTGILFITIFCLLLVGLIFRTPVTFLVFICTPKMRWKEKIFFPISWISKGTLQGILGAIALDSAVTPDQVKQGNVVLYFALFSIVVMAPLGYLIARIFSTRLLAKESRRPQREEPIVSNDRKLSYFDEMSRCESLQKSLENITRNRSTKWTDASPVNYQHKRLSNFHPTQLSKYDLAVQELDNPLYSMDQNFIHEPLAQEINLPRTRISLAHSRLIHQYLNLPLNAQISAPDLVDVGNSPNKKLARSTIPSESYL